MEGTPRTKYPVYQQEPHCPTCFTPLARPEWWNQADKAEWVKPVTVFCGSCKTTTSAQFYIASRMGDF